MRKILIQVPVADIKKRPLLARTNAATRCLAVFRIQRVRDLHPGDDLAERNKSIRIMRR